MVVVVGGVAVVAVDRVVVVLVVWLVAVFAAIADFEEQPLTKTVKTKLITTIKPTYLPIFM